MKKDVGLKPTSIKIAPELHRRLKLACVHLDLTHTEAIEAGLKLWLASTESRPEGSTTPANEVAALPPKDPQRSVLRRTLEASLSDRPFTESELEWIEKLLYVVRCGQPRVFAALLTNLDTFADMTAILAGEVRVESFTDASAGDWDKQAGDLARAIEQAEKDRRASGATPIPRKRVAKGRK